MVYNVVVKEEALADSIDAWLYYEEQQIGLGDRFLNILHKKYRDLSQNPKLYSFIYSDKEKTLRDIKLDSFPYVVIYDVVGNNVIVYAVHNTYKDRKRR